MSLPLPDLCNDDPDYVFHIFRPVSKPGHLLWLHSHLLPSQEMLTMTLYPIFLQDPFPYPAINFRMAFFKDHKRAFRKFPIPEQCCGQPC